jgi:hypothetical protein
LPSMTEVCQEALTLFGRAFCGLLLGLQQPRAAGQYAHEEFPRIGVYLFRQQSNGLARLHRDS